MKPSDVASALKQHLGVTSASCVGDDAAAWSATFGSATGSELVVISGDAPVSVLDGARAVAFVGPIVDESSWIEAWTARGLRRDLSFEHAVLIRNDEGDWRARTEAKLGALVKEVEARSLVALEYHHELVARDRRAVELEYMSAPTAEETVGDPSVWMVAQGLSELRRRWAPPRSLRTRALDLAFAGIQRSQDGLLRVLDVRDSILDHVRTRMSTR